VARRIAGVGFRCPQFSTKNPSREALGNFPLDVI
jgi:hypothetical protein